MKKQPTNYAFIDSQNLNLGIKSQGWKLDWRKFRQYLRNKNNYIVRIDLLKKSLTYKNNQKKTGIRGRSKP